jgi:hypothetical protein
MSILSDLSSTGAIFIFLKNSINLSVLKSRNLTELDFQESKRDIRQYILLKMENKLKGKWLMRNSY